MSYDEANAFSFAYYLMALRAEALPPPAGVVVPNDNQLVRVSLIVPAYNMWILTLNCLRSLVVAEHGAAGFEVILADDASSDETPQIVERNPWLRHVRLERNSGFIDNCNHAAEAARGELLLFLNNDILVGMAGWGRAGHQAPPGPAWWAAAYGSDGGLLESGGSSGVMAMCGTTAGASAGRWLNSTMSARWIT